MKICKDCKFYQYQSAAADTCGHEKAERGGVDLVTGEQEPNISCIAMRGSGDVCGEAGKLFAPMESRSAA